MSIFSSELIYRSLLYFIWVLCQAVNLSPEELCLTDYVLTYDIIFFKEHDLKTLISIAVYSSFSFRMMYAYDRDVNDGVEGARQESQGSARRLQQ